MKNMEDKQTETNEPQVLSQVFDSLFEKLTSENVFSEEDINKLTILRKNDQLHLRDELRKALTVETTKEEENENT